MRLAPLQISSLCVSARVPFVLYYKPSVNVKPTRLRLVLTRPVSFGLTAAALLVDPTDTLSG